MSEQEKNYFLNRAGGFFGKLFLGVVIIAAATLMYYAMWFVFHRFGLLIEQVSGIKELHGWFGTFVTGLCVFVLLGAFILIVRDIITDYVKT